MPVSSKTIDVAAARISQRNSDVDDDDKFPTKVDQINESPQFDVHSFLRKTLSDFGALPPNTATHLIQPENEDQEPDPELDDAGLFEAEPGENCKQKLESARRKQQRFHRKRNSPKLRKAMQACAYCGSNATPKSELYCKQCVKLSRSSKEINRRIFEQMQETRPLVLDEQCQLPTATANTIENQQQLLPLVLPATKPNQDSSSFVARCSNSVAVVSRSTVSCDSVSPSVSQNSLYSLPTCRICHIPSTEKAEALISPCLCNGSLKHVHRSCLVRWLLVSTKKSCLSFHCELCGYCYKTQHCLEPTKIHFPNCCPRDRILHLLFLIMLIVMLGCVALAILYLSVERVGSRSLRSSISVEDIVVIVCSVIFFCALLLAAYSQYRTESTIFTVLFHCWLINKLWRIRNFSPEPKSSVTAVQPPIKSLDNREAIYLIERT